MKSKKIKPWEWILSLLITGTSGSIIWTNNSIDLFNKLGWALNPGQAFMVLGISFMFGLSWISYLLFKKGGYL